MWYLILFAVYRVMAFTVGSSILALDKVRLLSSVLSSFLT